MKNNFSKAPNRRKQYGIGIWKKSIFLSIFLSFYLLSTLSAYAQFAGGTGTAEDPFQITTLAHLNGIKTHLADSSKVRQPQTGNNAIYRTYHYRLMNDIDLGNGTNAAWAPIGTSGSSAMFVGNLHGGGHTLSNLNYTGTTQYLGLFGVIGQGAHIDSLRVEGGSITHNRSLTGTGATYGYLGAIAGYAINTSATGEDIVISNCYANVTLTQTQTSTSSNTGGSYVGGLVGYAYANTTSSGGAITIENSYSESPISETTTQSDGGLNMYIGGLVGYANRSASGKFNILNNYRNASITNTQTGTAVTTYVGGVVGNQAGNATNPTYGVIDKNYATGSIDAATATAVGGVVGYSNRGVIRNSVALLSSITGATAGRIVGNTANSPTLATNNAIESLLVNNAEITNGTAANKNGLSKTNTELQTKSTYETLSWDFDDVWAINPGEYPHLKWEDPVGPTYTVTVIKTPGIAGPASSYSVIEGASFTLNFTVKENFDPETVTVKDGSDSDLEYTVNEGIYSVTINPVNAEATINISVTLEIFDDITISPTAENNPATDVWYYIQFEDALTTVWNAASTGVGTVTITTPNINTQLYKLILNDDDETYSLINKAGDKIQTRYWSSSYYLWTKGTGSSYQDAKFTIIKIDGGYRLRVGITNNIIRRNSAAAVSELIIVSSNAAQDRRTIQFVLPKDMFPDFVIEPGITETETNYTAGHYGDIVFKSNDSSTGKLTITSNNLTVNGVVKLQKTFTEKQWYPIGFPFALASVVDDTDDDYKGEALKAFDGESGDYWLKSYLHTATSPAGDGTGFLDKTAIAAHEGYIIQFPKFYGAENPGEITVLFTSTAGPVLKNTNVSEITLASTYYTLVANPSVGILTDISAASHHYPYTSDKKFLLTTPDLEVQPFEALIAANLPSGVSPITTIGDLDGEGLSTGLDSRITATSDSNDPVVETKYYTTQGVEVQKPSATGIYIVKEIHASQKATVTKTIHKSINK
ncbi:MAG: hypothetical protein LBO74_08090 [Candidatus Symbiothrix sp.]|jgi:hypothetical protein|nr:hypothetical protein [Candidatus Symbiothrix sp.]